MSQMDIAKEYVETFDPKEWWKNSGLKLLQILNENIYADSRPRQTVFDLEEKGVSIDPVLDPVPVFATKVYQTYSFSYTVSTPSSISMPSSNPSLTPPAFTVPVSLSVSPSVPPEAPRVKTKVKLPVYFSDFKKAERRARNKVNRLVKGNKADRERNRWGDRRMRYMKAHKS